VWWPLRGKFCSRLIKKKKLTRSEGPFERGKGLKETWSLWPPQRGVGLREPNLGKTNLRVTLFIRLRFVLHPLADSFIFLTLTRLVVVIIFENFSFALFTPPPSRRLSLLFSNKRVLTNQKLYSTVFKPKALFYYFQSLSSGSWSIYRFGLYFLPLWHQAPKRDQSWPTNPIASPRSSNKNTKAIRVHEMNLE
jgi:hypothetical protein